MQLVRRRRSRVASASVWLAGAIALGLAIPPCGAGAATVDERPAIVAFISPADAGAVVVRLRAELAVAGFDLRLAEGGAWPPSRDRMEQVARREAAVAALALVPDDGHAATEIWVVDRVTGKTVVRVFGAPPPGHGDEADLLAVSAVETLRATLMEINVVPRQAQGEIAPPPAVRALVAPDSGRFAARLAPAVVFSRGGVGAVWQLALGATMALAPRVRVGLEGLLPLTGANVSGPEGTAEVRLWLAGPFVETSLVAPGRGVDIRLAVGAWAALVHMRGNASAPYTGTTAEVASVAPHVDVVVGWSVARRLAVGARFAAAIAAPGVTVRFPGRDAATWGRPLGVATAVVEARFD